MMHHGLVWVISCDTPGCGSWGFGDRGDQLGLLTAEARQQGWVFADVVSKGQVVSTTVCCPTCVDAREKAAQGATLEEPPAEPEPAPVVVTVQ